ncbi:glycosyltransferase [Nocardioides montaniterrae]
MRTALWVVPVSDLAGVARHVLDTVTAGLPGWRLVVLCPPGPLADAVREAGGAVIAEPFGPEAGPRTSARTLRAAVVRLRPDVVHSHLSYADVIVAGATPRGPLLVTTEHGIAADDLVYHGSAAKARVMARVHAARLRRFDLVLAVSEATAAAMRDKWRPRQEILVVPNGVDRGLDTPLAGARGYSTNDGSIRVLSLARLAPEKRLPDLLRAFALVHRDQPDATLTLAGTGPLEAELRALAGDLQIATAVTFPGYVDAAAALAEHDVMALLSVWENCSYALLDALVAGVGVVASEVGGNPEILPDRCLVDAADHAAVAAKLVVQVDPAHRPRLAEDWPTTAQMATRIADAYAGAQR